MSESRKLSLSDAAKKYARQFKAGRKYGSLSDYAREDFIVGYEAALAASGSGEEFCSRCGARMQNPDRCWRGHASGSEQKYEPGFGYGMYRTGVNSESEPPALPSRDSIRDALVTRLEVGVRPSGYVVEGIEEATDAVVKLFQ